MGATNCVWFTWECAYPFSPLVVGSMGATVGLLVSGNWAYLSVPLSSGQWVQLHSRSWCEPEYFDFQSPCRRVNGCNGVPTPCGSQTPSFQSPCRRVNGCNRPRWCSKNPAVVRAGGFLMRFRKAVFFENGFSARKPGVFAKRP